MILFVLSVALCGCADSQPPSDRAQQFTGSQSCRPCHEEFYQLWAPSHHGLAMRPFSADFARKELTAHHEAIAIGGVGYRAEIDTEKGRVIEAGPDGERAYPMEHVLGGKNVYYFLTPMERGRLQTLPIAYDVRRKEWFDTSASGMRHVSDEPVDWRDAAYTFNTACYRCHVSQLSTNYDLAADTYETTWAEPGINCETCHGPGEEHIRVCANAPEGSPPEDLEIERGGSSFTVEQNNATCAPCHAKMNPLTDSFMPGERFFDHYDLNTLEDTDFYPDGRDLGENYTYTLWLMNPCAKAGAMSCLHCHTSSGRYKHADDPNRSCLPCHEARVENATTHTRHKADSEGNKCIACHMPKTEFARMVRSDHSMLPPTPGAFLAHQSPDGCTLCHSDHDAAWCDEQVRSWHGDYQKGVLHRAGLVAAARARDWTLLPEMLGYIKSDERDAVFATTLIRLLRALGDRRIAPALVDAMADPSPLVRGAAAESLGLLPSAEAAEALVEAAGDDFRLVRIKAVAALAGYGPLPAGIELTDRDRTRLGTALDEYRASLLARPDQWSSHYNMGNYLMNRGALADAKDAYEMALKLEPRAILTLVNLSIVHARLGQADKARECLERALDLEPRSAVAHFNMGLVMAERGETAAAEEHLRAALETEPDMAEAAYNLGVLLAGERPAEAIGLLGEAYRLAPSAKYGYTLAFYQREAGMTDDAVETLIGIIEEWPTHVDATLLLGAIYTREKRNADAEALFRDALDAAGLSARERHGSG